MSPSLIPTCSIPIAVQFSPTCVPTDRCWAAARDLAGIAGAYLALAATYLDDLGYLTRIPVLSLVLIVVGVPLTAAAAGWLLAGREPPAIARPAIE